MTRSIDNPAQGNTGERRENSSLEYLAVREQLDRFGTAAFHMGIDDNSWKGDESSFDGIAELDALYSRMESPDYQVKEYEKTFLHYMDTELARAEARAGINIANVKTYYGSDHDNVDESLIKAFEQEKANKDKRLERLDDTISHERRIAIKGELVNYEKTIEVMSGAAKRPLTGSEFMIAARAYDAGQMNDDELQTAEKLLKQSAIINKREEKAYITLLADAPEKAELLSDTFDIPSVTDRVVAQRNNDAPEQELSGKQRRSDARTARSQNRPDDAPSDDDGDEALRRLEAKLGVTDNDDTEPAPNPQPGSGDDGGKPPRTPDDQRSGDGDDGEKPGKQEKKDVPSDLASAQKRYLLRRDALAKMTAFGGRKNLDNPEFKNLQNQFNDAINWVIRFDPTMQRIIDPNSDMDLANRTVEIADYHFKMQNDLRAAQAQFEGETRVGKISNFLTQHKGKLMLGAVALGLATGGIAGLITGLAIHKGAQKFAQKEQAGRGGAHHKLERKGLFGFKRSQQAEYDYGMARAKSEALDLADQAGLAAMGEDADGNKAFDFTRVSTAVHARTMEDYEKNVIKGRARRRLGAVGVGLATGGLVHLGGHLVGNALNYQFTGGPGSLRWKLSTLDQSPVAGASMDQVRSMVGYTPSHMDMTSGAFSNFELFHGHVPTTVKIGGLALATGVGLVFAKEGVKSAKSKIASHGDRGSDGPDDTRRRNRRGRRNRQNPQHAGASA